MKLLMMSSNALNISVGTVGSARLFGTADDDVVDGDWGGGGGGGGTCNLSCRLIFNSNRGYIEA